jgi:hypothetical protein
MVTQLASTVVTATGSGAEYICFEGLIRVNVGGTLTPGITFSAAPTSPLMKAHSYICFTPIGSNTATVLGAVG